MNASKQRWQNGYSDGFRVGVHDGVHVDGCWIVVALDVGLAIRVVFVLVLMALASFLVMLKFAFVVFFILIVVLVFLMVLPVSLAFVFVLVLMVVNYVPSCPPHPRTGPWS
jgi:hypothetical protein